MKSIVDFLREKKVPTLIHVCQRFGLRGYSNLRKEEIIKFIDDNLNDPQFKENLQYIIPDNGTTALILKTMIDNKNQIKYSKLRQEILQRRSGTTFRDNFRKLLSRYVIYEDEKSDGDNIYLPKEFNDSAKLIIEKRIKEDLIEEISEEEIEEEIINEQQKKEIKKIEQLLYSKKYMTVEGLQFELISQNMKISGTKNELIQRLLYETKDSLEDIISFLMTKDDLKEICRDFELPVSGSKDELIERILERLPPSHPKEIAKSIEIKEPKLQVNKENLKLKSYEEDTIPEKFNMKKKINSFLENIKLDYRTISDIKTLAGQIFSNVQNLKIMNPNYNNTEISRDPKEQLILINNNEETLAISVWYFDKYKSPGGQKQKISHNVMTYKTRYSKNLICYIYDPAGKLANEDVEMYKQFSQIIHKNEREFKI